MSLSHLPSLDQLSADTTKEDPIETVYAIPPGGQRHLSLEYFMGFKKRWQTDFHGPCNQIKMRSSMAKLLEETAWILLPTNETLEAMMTFQEQNLACARRDRALYTEVFPAQEYEYVFIPSSLNTKIAIISSDGERSVFRHPYENLPHFRSTAHPFHVVFNAFLKKHLASNRGARVPLWLTHITLLWWDAPEGWFRDNESDEDESDDEEEAERFEVEKLKAEDRYQLKDSESWRSGLAWGHFPLTEQWVKKQAKALPRA